MLLKDYLSGLNHKVAETAIGIRSYSKFLKKQANIAMDYLYQNKSGSISISLPHIIVKQDGDATEYRPVEAIEEVVTCNLSDIDLSTINEFDVINITRKDGSPYPAEITYSEILSRLTGSVQMMLAEAEILDACLEQDMLKNMDSSAVISRVRAVLPNVSNETLSFVSDSLSGMTNPLNICYNLLSGNAGALFHEEYSDDTDSILISATPYTGNPCQSAIQMIGDDISGIFNVALNNIFEIGNWISGIVGNLFSFISKLLLPSEAFTYYEKVGDSHSGLFDIPYLQFSVALDVAANVMYSGYGDLHRTQLIAAPARWGSNYEWPNYGLNVTNNSFMEGFVTRFLTDDGLNLNSNIEIPTKYGIVRYTLQPVFKSSDRITEDMTIIEKLNYNFSTIVVQAYLYDIEIDNLSDQQILDKLSDNVILNCEELMGGRAVIPYEYSTPLNVLTNSSNMSNVKTAYDAFINRFRNGLLDSTQTDIFKRWKCIKGQDPANDPTGSIDVQSLDNNGKFALSVHLAALLSYVPVGVDSDVGKYFGQFYIPNNSITSENDDWSLIVFEPVDPWNNIFPMVSQGELWSPYLSNYYSPVNLHYQTTEEQAKDVKKAIYRGAAIVGAIFAVTTIKHIRKSINRKKLLASQTKLKAASNFLNSNSPEDRIALDKAIKKDNLYNKIGNLCGGSSIIPNDTSLQKDILDLLK